jgi:hypothetical protein
VCVVSSPCLVYGCSTDCQTKWGHLNYRLCRGFEPRGTGLADAWYIRPGGEPLPRCSCALAILYICSFTEDAAGISSSPATISLPSLKLVNSAISSTHTNSMRVRHVEVIIDVVENRSKKAGLQGIWSWGKVKHQATMQLCK